jgi:hypothetical protein
MSISLGGSTFPSPVGAPESEVFIGEQSESQSGVLLTSYSAIKTKWTLNWVGLSSTDKANLWTKYCVVSSQTYVDTGSTSHTVVTKHPTWRATPWTKSDATLAYDVSFEIEEAS